MNTKRNNIKEVPERVLCYLRENDALRHAIGASESATLEPRFIGEGEHNLNFCLAVPDDGKRYVLRINVASQPFHDDQVAYEHAALTALAPSGRTPLPVYLDNSANAPGKGALVISFCEGDELDFDKLRPGDLACAAQIMADIHAMPVPKDCALFQPKDPLKVLFDECLQRFKAYRSSAFEDPKLTRTVESFIAATQSMLAFTTSSPEECSHIVNTETLPSHFLIPAGAAVRASRAHDGISGKPGAFARIESPGSFVDWERPIIGEVAQDLAYFVSPTTTFWDSEFLFPESMTDAFLHMYWDAVDGRFAPGRFEERFRAFRMMTALRSATWCCKALLTYRPGGDGHTTDKTARKLPVYLSEDFMNMLAKDCFGL